MFLLVSLCKFTCYFINVINYILLIILSDLCLKDSISSTEILYSYKRIASREAQ